MQLVRESISLDELNKMSEKMFGELVKAVVDIEQGVMVVDAELHSDQEEFLLEHGSEQANLWGINLHPANFGIDGFVEFDSMINIRPWQGNRSRGVENVPIQNIIRKLWQNW